MEDIVSKDSVVVNLDIEEYNVKKRYVLITVLIEVFVGTIVVYVIQAMMVWIVH